MSTVVNTDAVTQLEHEILEEWINQMRTMIVRDGSVVRAGRDCTIEVQLMHRPGHVFQPINAPGGTQHFGTEARRDEIVRRLQGHSA